MSARCAPPALAALKTPFLDNSLSRALEAVLLTSNALLLGFVAEKVKSVMLISKVGPMSLAHSYNGPTAVTPVVVQLQEPVPSVNTDRAHSRSLLTMLFPSFPHAARNSGFSKTGTSKTHTNKQTNYFPLSGEWFCTLTLQHEPLCCMVVKCHARRLLSPLQRCVAPCRAVCACGVRAQRMLVRCALGDAVQGCSDVDMNRVNRPPPPGMPLHSCMRWILHAAAAACASVPWL
jgi:hypothetical protein